MSLASDAPWSLPLPFLAVFEVRDDDRARWLQGQVTADVHDPRRATGLHAFHLDAQGRIRAELRLVEADDAFVAIVDRERAAPLLADLDRRIVMEDVSLHARDDRAVVGIYGPDAAAIATAAGAHILVASDRFGPVGVECVVASDEAEPFARAVADACASRGGGAVSLEAIDAARVVHAMPRYGVDFGDTALPQETGLHARTVSFTKGCYVGQEPVVMIEHRGKPPRRAVLLRFEGNPPAVPFELRTGDDVVAGRCTSSTTHDGVALGLATLKRSIAESEPTLVAGSATARIERFVGAPPPARAAGGAGTHDL